MGASAAGGNSIPPGKAPIVGCFDWRFLAGGLCCSWVKPRAHYVVTTGARVSSSLPRAANTAALPLVDQAAVMGAAPHLSATVIGRDGAIVAAVSRNVECGPPGSPAGEQWVVVTVAGDVDADTEPLVRSALTAALGPDRRICLDVRDVTFFGAAGANTVVAAHLNAVRTGGQFTVRGARGIVRRVLAITGVDQFVTIGG
jgi:anti-anti-sigma factor